MVEKDKAIIAGAIVVAAVIIAVALIFVTWRIHTSGTLKVLGLKVYSDPSCTTEVTSIDWGRLGQGETAEVKVYVKVEGNTPANLTLKAENWNPADAKDYLTLTWNYAGQVIQPGQVLEVKFRLKVATVIVGVTDFRFDIVITATEVK